MASRKLTALPTATEVTTSDKIYIVDVSDTTESPQGTSKQATVDKIIPSGTWTPTISGLVNGISVTSLGGIYSRAGNTVSAMAVFDATLGLAQNQGGFQFSLPIASNFTDDLNCIGIVVNGIVLSDLVYFDVNADVDNNTVSVGLEGLSLNLNFPKLVIEFKYVIL